MAHRLVEYAKQAGAKQQDQVVETLFHEYFEKGGKINDLATLVSIGEAAGLKDVEAYLKSEKNKQKVMEQALLATAQGIHGVPFFKISMRNKSPVGFSGAQPVEVFEDAFRHIGVSQPKDA